jgi:hypothetical protein
MGREPRVDRSPEEKWQIVHESIKSTNVSPSRDRSESTMSRSWWLERSWRTAIGGWSGRTKGLRVMRAGYWCARVVCEHEERNSRAARKQQGPIPLRASPRLRRESQYYRPTCVSGLKP